MQICDTQKQNLTEGKEDESYNGLVVSREGKGQVHTTSRAQQQLQRNQTLVHKQDHTITLCLVYGSYILKLPLQCQDISY